MTRWLHILVTGLALLMASAPSHAQGSVEARVLPEDTTLRATGDGVVLDLALSQPVPFRVRLLGSPPRAVLEFDTVDWQGLELNGRSGLQAVRLGHRGDGWARMVLDLPYPMVPLRVDQAVSEETGRAQITIALQRVDLAAFEARIVDETAFARNFSDYLLHPDALPLPPREGAAPLRIMLDPGHGGVDPGAVREGVSEAQIVLTFAIALREELLRRGGFDVGMTRTDDSFVSLDGRLRAARDSQADLLLSLHADALPEGLATGAVVYTLSEEASDETAALLAARHDRDDLLSGVDLSGNTDDIASVLMSVAWQDTKLRNAVLAQALVDGIGAAGLRLHSRPLQSGAFSVLRAPDMPSALLELGFMSSPRDMARLRDPDWRARMAVAVADALEDWRTRDAALRDQMRHGAQR